MNDLVHAAALLRIRHLHRRHLRGRAAPPPLSDSAAHWLSDATAGILLGTSCALVTALVADQFQRRQNRLQRAAGTQCLAGGREYV